MVRGRFATVVAAATAAASFLALSVSAVADDQTFDFSKPGCCAPITPGPKPKPARVKRLRPFMFRGKKPGDTICDDVTVTGGAVPVDDLMLLTDTTSSMWKTIKTVKKEMKKLMDARKAVSDTRFGVASYRDELEYGYKLDQALTSNTGKVQSAINSLGAIGGNDTPEANLVALHSIATDLSVGWAPKSRHLVAWFGDAPGHEPSCPAPGIRHTRGSVLNALKAARISLIALSKSGGLDRGYDHHRNSHGKCTPPSGNAPIAPMQATFLTDGTNGVTAELKSGSGTEISDLIGLIDTLALEITASLNDCAGVFTTEFTPALPVYLEPKESTTLRQCVTIDRDACKKVKNGALFFSCSLEVLGTGALFAERRVSLTRLRC